MVPNIPNPNPPERSAKISSAPCLPRQRPYEPQHEIFSATMKNPTQHTTGPASATTCDFRVPAVTMVAAACHVELTMGPDLRQLGPICCWVPPQFCLENLRMLSSSRANELLFPNLYIYPIYPIHVLIHPEIIRSKAKKSESIMGIICQESEIRPLTTDQHPMCVYIYICMYVCM